MAWLFLLSVFLHWNVVQSFPVFVFNDTSSSPTATPSYAYLVNDLKIPDKFILCTSAKQARFDDVGFYVISGKDSAEWLTAQLSTFSAETWLTIWWDESGYWVGRPQGPMLNMWYHICLSFDLKTNEIEANING